MGSFGDSNALILPSKSKKLKQKSNSQPIVSCQDKKLSKSQKRKLKKLEEEEGHRLLLSKSLRSLEKYIISGDAHSLLYSSQNIGQAETMREKRRRVMQFSKAGLAMPENDVGAKRKKVGSCESEVYSLKSTFLESSDKNMSFEPVFITRASEVDASDISSLKIADTNATLKPALIERTSRNSSAYSESSQGPGEVNRLSDLGRTEPSRSYKDLDSCKAMNLDAGNLLPSQSPDSSTKTVVPMVNRNGVSKVNSCVTRCIGSDPIPGSPSVPTVVNVSRPKEVENGRRDLPIIMMEQEIMETINNHNSVIVCGETGCGKTTQIPQFLYEAGYGSAKSPSRRGMIGITQPRRVAVFSTAKRVAYELGLQIGKEVGFQVRHDRKIGDNCSIKFMTDGILLRELKSDFLLKCYSVIILDEAHERTLNTDVLIGILSRSIKERQKLYEVQQKIVLSGKEIKPEMRIFPLKLILMSATLRVEDFTSGQTFNEPPPVIEIPTRQFPVTTHFSKRTVLTDYIGEAQKMVLKIHKKLPSGGILVFVTGQREVEDLCRKLRKVSKQFGTRNWDIDKQNEVIDMNDKGQIDGCSVEEINETLDTHSDSDDDSYDGNYDDSYVESDDGTSSSISSVSDSDLDIESDLEVDGKTVDFAENVNLDSLKAAFEGLTAKSTPTLDNIEKGIDSAMQDICSIQAGKLPKQKGEKKSPVVGQLHVLPLYARLPAVAQLRVFGNVKEGERLVVVATNVAETSLTIPGIRYVVDTGREKVKEYNPSNGMESYDIKWISKASASQRAGRAGRTGPGHCYCLYSSAALSNEFQDFSCAEILKIPADDVTLFLKSMGIIEVKNFPFPAPPDAKALKNAERCLMGLEALDDKGGLTPLGKAMAEYPMGPRHSKLLLLAIQITKETNVRRNLVLGYAVAVAAALSSRNPFLFQFDNSQTNSEDTEQEDDSGSFSCQKTGVQTAKLSCWNFHNHKSDALTVAYALQCFEQSKNPSQFCNENALHLKTMQDMSMLRKQLLHLVFNQRYKELPQEFTWTHGTKKDVDDYWNVSSDKSPLLDTEEDIICQAICAGWADKVAKRIKGTSSEGERKVNAIRYQAYLIKETVFLRHWSPVSSSAPESRAAPEILVYNELIRTKHPFIYGATSVKSEWLLKHAGSLCSYSEQLTDSLLSYDPFLDQLFINVTPCFGELELLKCTVPIKDDKKRIKAFAYALLDGQVLPCLKTIKKFLAAAPSNILKEEALGQKRVCNLISKLTSRTVDSCATLREAWNEYPQLLHSELLEWYQNEHRHQFKKLWDKMHQEALLEPRGRFPERSKRKKHSRKG